MGYPNDQDALMQAAAFAGGMFVAFVIGFCAALVYVVNHLKVEWVS